MSSLRISQHRNPVDGPTGSAEPSRAEAGDDRSGFALALGAAAAAPNAGTALLSGDGGGGSGATLGSRKREDASTELSDVPGSLVVPNLFAFGNLWMSQPVSVDADDTVSPATGSADVSPNLAVGAAIDTTSPGAVTGFGTVTQPSSGASVGIVGQALDLTDGRQTAASRAGGAPVTRGEPVDASSAALPSHIPLFEAQIVGAAGRSVPPDPLGADIPTDLVRASIPTGSVRAGVSVGSTPSQPVAPGDTVVAPALGKQPPVAGGTPPAAVVADPTFRDTAEPSSIAGTGNFAALIAPMPNSALTSDTPSAAGGDISDAISGVASAIAGPATAGPDMRALPRLDAARLSPMASAGLSASLAPPSTAQSGSQNLAFGDDPAGAGTRGDGMTLGISLDGAAGAAGTLMQTAGNDAVGALASASNSGLTATVDATTAGGMSDQIAAHLLRLASDGSREMVLRLHPAELGDLTIRVAVTGRDVAAWFASPQPQVQSAISAALGQLQVNLGDAGYNLSGAWVGGDASGAHRQMGGQPAAPLRTSATMRSRPFSTATAALPSAGGLNIYV